MVHTSGWETSAHRMVADDRCLRGVALKRARLDGAELDAGRDEHGDHVGVGHAFGEEMWRHSAAFPPRCLS